MAFTKTIKTDLVRTAILTNINDDLEELYSITDGKAASDHTHGVGGTVTFSTGTEDERFAYTPLADMLWYEYPSKSFYFYDYSVSTWYLDDVTLLNNTGLKVLDTNSSDYLTIKPGSNLTEDRIFTLTTGDSDRTLTLDGDPTLSDWFDQEVKTTSSPTFVGITVGNTGLHILDLDDSNYLAIKAGSDLTSNRQFTLTTGNSDRVLTLSGDPTIADWFDQSVKTTSSPTFAELTLTTDLAITHGGTGSSSASTALVAFGLTATASEVNTACDGITATASEINTACDGITATSTEINTACDGITATASEINTVCDGILATSTEVNRACDGITATSTEINTVCDGILATSTEVNRACDGILATASEINTACDGITATASEINNACDLSSNNFFGTGRKVLFYENVAPLGWTIQNTLDDKLVFITKGSVAGGDTGGTVHDSGSWTQPNHTHTGPSHTHDVPVGNRDAGNIAWLEASGGVAFTATRRLSSGLESGSYASKTTRSYGGGTGNTGGSATANTWRPAAYCCIIAAKS